jgi:hypothetical protein
LHIRKVTSRHPVYARHRAGTIIENKPLDQHRDLEVDGFLAVRVELGGFVAFYQSEDERREEVAGEMEKDPEQGAGVDARAPGAHVRDGGNVGGGNGGSDDGLLMDAGAPKFGFRETANRPKL